jgi:hypothetical protein
MTIGPVAIIAAGLLVWRGSVEAFSAQTSNVGNNWSTGSVTLVDDDAGAAAFSVLNVTPGQTGTHCILVTSTSTIPGVVKFYIARLGAQGLEKNITLTGAIGHGGSFASCDGFVATQTGTTASIADTAATVSSYATGALPWATTGVSGESMTYEMTWRFDTTGLTQAQVDALQGKSVSVDAVWELQSN